MLVKDWMTTDLVTIAPRATLAEAERLLYGREIGRLVVTDEQGQLAGIFARSDLQKQLAPVGAAGQEGQRLERLATARVEDAMTRDVRTLSPEETIEKAALLVFESKITGFPVLSGRCPIGILTTTDLFRAFIEILGLRAHGVRMAFELERGTKTLEEVVDKLKQARLTILSLFTYRAPHDRKRHLVVRARGEETRMIPVSEVHNA